MCCVEAILQNLVSADFLVTCGVLNLSFSTYTLFVDGTLYTELCEQFKSRANSETNRPSNFNFHTLIIYTYTYTYSL